MTFTPVVISLPIADRRASCEFYRHWMVTSEPPPS